MTSKTAVAVTESAPGVSVIAELDNWTRTHAEVHDIYQGPGVGMYDFAAQAYDLSTPIMLTCLDNGPVLELACGAGRVGVPLLSAGVDYYGVDNSTAMLDRFRSNAADQGIDPGHRLIDGDAVDLSWAGSGRFARVMVPAFSLVLFDERARRSMFGSIGEILATGGEFTAEVYNDAYYEHCYSGQTSLCSWMPGEEGSYVVSFAELHETADPLLRQEQIRFIHQYPGQRPQVMTTWKWVYTADRLVSDLEASGYEVTDRRPSLYPLAEWISARPL